MRLLKKVVDEQGEIIGYKVEINRNVQILNQRETYRLACKRKIDNIVYVRKEENEYIRAKRGNIPVSKIYSKGIIKVSEKDRKETSTTSKGNQAKWYTQGYWVKVDYFGYEGLSEELSSLLLEHIKDVRFVKYRTCEIVDNNIKQVGCCSPNMLNRDETLISFARIIESNILSLEEYNKAIKNLNTEEKILFIIKLIERFTGLDITQYISYNLFFDSIILNEDRHFNNLALIYNLRTSKYTIPPIFDNGLSLLSDEIAYGKYEVGKAINKVKSKPFSTDFKKQVTALRNIGAKPLEIDIIKFREVINSYDNILYNQEQINRAKKVLLKRLEIMEGVSWVRK